jgi:ribosomal protein L37AE/L43A
MGQEITMPQQGKTVCPFCDSSDTEKDGALSVCNCCARAWLGPNPVPKKGTVPESETP